MSARPDPVFAEPWHAQLFALTVHLNEQGLFAWPDWAARFGATLKRHGLSRELDGGDDYFAAWLETLEALLDEAGAAPGSVVEDLRAAWERAYLMTPHGDPVHLAES
ncbi:nitrile hydratase accessory protein [Marinibacterium profundimaris]|uniref:Nitrile hydratase n=1 Tax=Marinibacterium profundimaris TaxID=1679460 RepID=A0A225NG88_9RHOB|nr:nitrile hydratase accessory protein [Marinibacterium profundimaris]OWU72588.1 nitrile hydratase [Marinibacterium profundimaris]